MALDTDGLGISFGKTLSDKIVSYDNELKGLADSIKMKDADYSDTEFDAAYQAALQAVVDLQESKKAQLEAMQIVLNTT